MTRTLQNQIAWYTRLQLFIAAAMLAVGAFFYLGWYRPATRQLEQCNTSIIQRRGQLAEGQAKVSVLPQLKQDVLLLQSKADHNNKKMPHDMELDSFVQDITNIYQQAGMRKWDSHPSGVKRLDPISELPIKMKFEGDFINVVQFLRQAEDMVRPTRVQNLSIRSLDSKSGQVAVELVMNIYYSEK